jgi:hypothetical protein
MQRHGKTAAGTQRWRCVDCALSSIRQRSDQRYRQYFRSFVKWLTGTREQSAIARELSISRMQLSRRFELCWSLPAPASPPATEADHVLILDGVYLSGRTNAVLIARNLTHVRSWDFHERECFLAWDRFLARIPAPAVVVCDGQKGLSEAIKRHWPHTKVQRCLVHVERFVRSRISMRPKTEAGRALWQLTRALWDVETTADANRWIKRFHTWEQQYADFLKERSYAPETGRWWYTHRTLRAARSHLKNALPHLFTFTVVPGTPRTSNHVEGGTNARLKELTRRHRGLSPERKRTLAAYFLHSKSEKKPTRNVT